MGDIFLTIVVPIRNMESRLSSVESWLREIPKSKIEVLFIVDNSTDSTFDDLIRIKKSNEYLIYNSLYKDANLKIKNFSEKSFEEIDNEDLYILGDIYKKFVEKFSTLNIKKISLLPFYRNLYNLSNDNPYYLYGKRILDLTFYQIEVFSYARYFKNIISESKNPPPEDYLDDPDKIIEWFDSSKNINELLDNKNSKNADGSSIVGATKEDLKKLGKEENGVSIFEEASKKGGKLSMEDMMKLHGIG